MADNVISNPQDDDEDIDDENEEEHSKLKTPTTNETNNAQITGAPTSEITGDDYEHDDDHSHEDLSKIQAWKIHQCMERNPICSFIIALSVFILMSLFLIIMAKQGALVNFTAEVPMYMRGQSAYDARDAYLAALDAASFDPKASKHNNTRLPQSIESTKSLQLLFILKDTSKTIFDVKYLKIIDLIESKILETQYNYGDYCKRVYNNSNPSDYKCARHTSITQFFDKKYFIPSVNQNYDVYPTLNNFINYFSKSKLVNSIIDVNDKNYTSNNINNIVEYWARYGAGSLPINSSYGKGIYNGEQMESIFWYINPLYGTVNSLINLFKSLVDSNFGQTPYYTKGKAVVSIIPFGLPLSGYKSETTKIAEQEDKIGEWCYNSFDKLFTDLAKEYENEIIFRWSCSTMSSYALLKLLNNDALLMGGTFISVYLFMVYMSGSFFLGSWGMIMIFLNFIPSILLYRYVSQQSYFGTLNLLGMFIILAIGADDIFVINDTFAQIRLRNDTSQKKKATVAQRLTATIKHAGKVMATTSLSTIFSFLGNTTSQFPAVYTFGAFSAWLIFCNYIAVVFFYPCILNIHDKYLFTPTLKRPWCICKCCKIANKKYNIDEDKSKCYPIKPDFNNKNEKRPIDAFFENIFYTRFIYKCRCCTILIFCGIFVLFGFFAAQLEPDPNLPQLFPSNNNYQEYSNDLGDNFANDNSYQVTNQILFGINGINRQGTDKTVPDDIGTVIWDESITIHTPNDQLYLSQLCDDLLCGYKDYDCRYNFWSELKISDPEIYGGSDLNIVKCFMKEFKYWVENDDASMLNTSEIESIILEYHLDQVGINITYFDTCQFDGTFPIIGSPICFAVLFQFVWLNENLPTDNPSYSPTKTNYDYWKDYIYTQPYTTGNELEDTVRLSTKLKFIRIPVLMDMYVSTNYKTGQYIRDMWTKYSNNWKNNVNGQVSIDKDGNQFMTTPNGLKSISFTDKGVFPYFYLQQQIIKEAFIGIGVSLALALLVLIIATQNFIMSFMSVIAIFSIVTCVIGFTVIMGWKLGVVEAIIFVMVVGMSVDYVVHLSEAYLHSNAFDRDTRTKEMLGSVGGSVLSGALSTIIGIIWLLPAKVDMFRKFGTTILFLIIVSCSYALFAFTAVSSLFGPQGSTGNVTICLKQCFCRHKLNKQKSNNLQTSLQADTHIELR